LGVGILYIFIVFNPVFSGHSPCLFSRNAVYVFSFGSWCWFADNLIIIMLMWHMVCIYGGMNH
jgi:hypothetical protein